jgi:hypothetical protein
MAELGLAASHREIGAAVTRLFEDVRAETKRTIEAKLGRASMATAVGAVTDTGETRLSGPTAARPRRRLAVGLAAGAGLLAGVGFAIWRSQVVTQPAAAVAPAAPAAAIPSAAPAPAIANQANLTATSPDATVRPDEPTPTQAAPTAPRPSRPAGGVAKVSTKRVPAAAEPHDKAALPAAEAPNPAPGKAGPPADCAHPFFVDTDGIKRFRPECM